MKVYCATLLTVLGISAITTTAFVAPRSNSVPSTTSTTCQASSLEEEFATAFQDDFYADYDPSKYDSQNNDSSRSNSSYGGGYDDSRPSRGRGGGALCHEEQGDARARSSPHSYKEQQEQPWWAPPQIKESPTTTFPSPSFFAPQQ
eukprot:scaffold1518_cov113-Skeletonema_menzelii.AAC.1